MRSSGKVSSSSRKWKGFDELMPDYPEQNPDDGEDVTLTEISVDNLLGVHAVQRIEEVLEKLLRPQPKGTPLAKSLTIMIGGKPNNNKSRLRKNKVIEALDE